MATTKEKVSNNYIPDDIVLYILSKLPVKSLKRFTCVCKSWANLFENPQFMSMYRNNFLSEDEDDDNSRLLLKQSMLNTHDNLFLLSGERFENNRVKLDWPPPLQEDDTNIFIWGSVVNGILCLYQGRDYAPAPEIVLKVVLWNPTTQEFKVIPPGSVDCPLGVDIWVELHGFGYDPVADDYKLIRHLCFCENHFLGDVPEPLWQIYNLRSNSWRNLDIEMPDRDQNQNEVYLNGVFHWLGFKQLNESPESVLVSFNLSDEVFHTTPLNWNGRYEVYHGHLAVLNGSIAMIKTYADTACFEISILGELGVKESWTNIFSIGPLPFVEHPIGVGKKGDVFFRKNNDELAWFDLSSQMIKDIGVKGEDSHCQIVIYKESLLPIGGINN